MDLREAAQGLLTYKDDVRECNRRGVALAHYVLAQIPAPEAVKPAPKAPEKPKKAEKEPEKPKKPAKKWSKRR